MPELVVPECPRCGAELELRPDGTAGVCKYCDAQVLVLQDKAGRSEFEIERRKEALELLRQDLAELEAQASQAQFRIQSAQNSATIANVQTALVPAILFAVMAGFGGFLSFLFYLLDISYVWGVSRTMCATIGTIIVIIGIAGALGSKAMGARAQQARREQALQSPEYFEAVRQLQELGPRIDLARQAVEKADTELRAILLGPGQPI